jgi:outer membrane protein TolC
MWATRHVEGNLAAGWKGMPKLHDEAAIAARRLLELWNTRCRGGVTSYLEVITAQNAALADEVTAVNILAQRMTSTVLLIQALRGGWAGQLCPSGRSTAAKCTGSN